MLDKITPLQLGQRLRNGFANVRRTGLTAQIGQARRTALPTQRQLHACSRTDSPRRIRLLIDFFAVQFQDAPWKTTPLAASRAAPPG